MGGKETKQSIPTGEHLQRRNTQWLLAQWECSSPPYLTPQIRNTAKKQIWGPLLQRLGIRTQPWQGSDNHRGKGHFCWIKIKMKKINRKDPTWKMFAISISGKELIYRLKNFYTSKIKRQPNGRKGQKYIYGYVIYIYKCKVYVSMNTCLLAICMSSF